MLVAESFADAGAVTTDRVVLAFDDRRRSRLRCRLESGEEFGYVLPPGTALRNGDRLGGADRRIIEVVAAIESVLEVRAADARELARAAYHLGNRHIPVEVGDGYLRFQPDHVLAEMLVGLGCDVTAIEAPFDPEGGAYRPHAHHAPMGIAAALAHGHDTMARFTRTGAITRTITRTNTISTIPVTGPHRSVPRIPRVQAMSVGVPGFAR